MKLGELSSSDRQFVEITDQLADLKRHPAWATYESLIIDDTIATLKDLLFNGELVDLGQVRGIRAALRALYLIKSRPEEMIQTARTVRDELEMKEMLDAGNRV